MARFERVFSMRWPSDWHCFFRSSTSSCERISKRRLSKSADSVRRWTWMGSLRSTRELWVRSAVFWGLVSGREGDLRLR